MDVIPLEFLSCLTKQYMMKGSGTKIGEQDS